MRNCNASIYIFTMLSLPCSLFLLFSCAFVVALFFRLSSSLTFRSLFPSFFSRFFFRLSLPLNLFPSLSFRSLSHLSPTLFPSLIIYFLLSHALLSLSHFFSRSFSLFFLSSLFFRSLFRSFSFFSLLFLLRSLFLSLFLESYELCCENFHSVPSPLFLHGLHMPKAGVNLINNECAYMHPYQLGY